jgi:hypothetical protein
MGSVFWYHTNMLNPVLLLIVSFLAANVVHGYLLYSQRNDRKSTISHHAVKSPRTQRFYVAGHIVAAISFYMFARTYFAGTPQATLLITAATIGFVADIIQALIPARGKIEKYHAFFAYIMAFSVIIIGVAAAFTIPQSPPAAFVSKALAVCLALSIPVSHIIEQRHFYRVQMVSLLIFYIELFVIVLGASWSQ